MLRGLALMAASACLLFSASANAQIASDSDLRCAVIGLSIAGTAAGNQQQQNAGTMIAIYYLGRVQGSAPGVNLEEEIFRLTTTLTPAQIDADRVRCGNEFRAMGEMLTQMGANLRARAQPQPQPQPN